MTFSGELLRPFTNSTMKNAPNLVDLLQHYPASDHLFFSHWFELIFYFIGRSSLASFSRREKSHWPADAPDPAREREREEKKIIVSSSIPVVNQHRLTIIA